MALMNFVTKGQFRTGYYSTSGNVGLIQFSQSTAQLLGTTQGILASSTHFQQLYYLDKYLKHRRVKGKIRSITDLYMVLFQPALLHKRQDGIVIYKRPSKEYEALKEFDYFQKGYFTLEDVSKLIESFLPATTPQGYPLPIENPRVGYPSPKNDNRILNWLSGMVAAFLIHT
ncbi:MAG: hypothetical protein R2822_22025 [Spirosomataceae bacterium]